MFSLIGGYQVWIFRCEYIACDDYKNMENKKEHCQDRRVEK